MPAKALLDTNILLYAISKSPAEALKAKAANDLIATVDFGISVQVCQEFYVAATGKIAQRISADEALRFLRLLVQRPVVKLTSELMFRAVELHQLHHISYWDAAIVAAAEELGATSVYSEDLNDGQKFGSVTVVNPFHAISPRPTTP